MVTIECHGNGEQCWWPQDCDEQHHQENVFSGSDEQVCEICGH
jgi:hypothetical protein